MTPATRAIDRTAQALASTGAPGTFATRRTVSGGELHLDVVGVGPIPLPLSRRARAACAASRNRGAITDRAVTASLVGA